MKPVKLYMKNIGPYLEETIDFTKLDNMFLIKGDTGAGKSIIFDAITFALYGELRGSRKGHAGDIKSRYALETDESYVEFTFETGGKIYKINRTVPYNYTNRNGRTDKKKSIVDLQRLDNENFITIPGNLSEIDEKLRLIIGLSVDEFSQIVILPQGEFAEFLHQKSSERAETLKKLFPVEFYSGITERIKKMADEENQKLKDQDTMIQTLSKNKDFSQAQEKITASEAEISDLQEAEKAFLEEQKKLAATTEALKHQKADSLEFQKAEQKLLSLENQKNDFDELQKLITNADKAKSFREYITLCESLKNNLENSQTNLKTAKNQQKNLQEKFEQLKNQENSMTELNSQNSIEDKNLALIQEKLKSAQGFEEKQAALKAAKINCENALAKKEEKVQQINKINEELNGKSPVEAINQLSQNIQEKNNKKAELEKELNDCKTRDDLLQKKNEAEQGLQKNKKDFNEEEEKSERTKATIQELKIKQKESEEKNQAYTVSLFLKKDLPCPVCGSIEHPSPAKKPEGLLSFEEQLKTFTENLESSQKLIKIYEKNIAGLEADLKNYEEGLKAINTKRKNEEVLQELSNLQDSITKEISQKEKMTQISTELENILQEEKDANENFNKFNTEYQLLENEIKNLENQLGEPLEALQKREGELSKNLKINKEKFENWQKLFNFTEKELAGANKAVEKSLEDVKNFEQQYNSKQSELNKKISESDFETLEQVKNASLKDEILENNRNRLNTYNEELKSAKDAVKTGQDKNPKNLETIEEELKEIAIAEKESSQKYETNHFLLESKQKELTEYKNDYDKVKDAQNKKLQLEEELKPLNALNDNLSGKNPQKLQLESWALGMYFEQVVEFASDRFFDISDGRFSFLLKKTDDSSGRGFKGLDLLVFDSHTGKTSDAAELSGGETFEASISLALAITDVVQNNNGGGIQLDSLFIDEGFGTLDPETLEKAMSVLTQLGQTKMIGMISHVSEMETYSGITSAIIVDKKNTGSSIRIV